jgi:hypothetical protein
MDYRIASKISYQNATIKYKKQFTCHINGNRFLGVYVAGIIAKYRKTHKWMHIRETKICQCSLQAVKTGLCKLDSYFHQIMTL